ALLDCLMRPIHNVRWACYAVEPASQSVVLNHTCRTCLPPLGGCMSTGKVGRSCFLDRYVLVAVAETASRFQPKFEVCEILRTGAVPAKKILHLATRPGGD